MVVHLGLSLLQDNIILLMRVSLRGSPSRRHNSSPHQQSLSQLKTLRRVSKPRRPCWHPSYATLVVPVP